MRAPKMKIKLKTKLSATSKIKTSITFASLFLVSIYLSGCLTIAPDHVLYSKLPSYDSSTPAQYDSSNSGFICFDDDGNGIITSSARDRYNNLVVKYKAKILAEKSKNIEPDKGLTVFNDKFGNTLYKIDKEHLYFFIIMNVWTKSGL